jgi:flagellar basal-body rod protein FlgB
VDLFANDATLAALSSALTFSGRRQTLIADNIANVNTPNYKRRDLDIAAFNAELSDALSLGGDSRGGAAQAARARALGDVVGAEVVEDNLFYRVDMGGVDIDREMSELAKTSLVGNAMGQLLSKRIAQYRMVIRDGR